MTSSMNDIVEQALQGQPLSGKDFPANKKKLYSLLREWRTGSPEVQKKYEEKILGLFKDEFPNVEHPLSLPPRLLQKLSFEHPPRSRVASVESVSSEDSVLANVGSKKESESAGNWKRARTPEGRKYWFNEKTKQRQYYTPVSCSHYL